MWNTFTSSSAMWFQGDIYHETKKQKRKKQTGRQITPRGGVCLSTEDWDDTEYRLGKIWTRFISRTSTRTVTFGWAAACTPKV